jgi:HSP20 family molecular chaperone IbpA
MENKEIISVRDINQQTIDELLRTQSSISPSVDIFENEDEFTLLTNMPGVSRGNIQVKIDGTSLLIFGKINFDEAVNKKYILNENEIGNYYRKFNLSDSIDVEKIKARYDNGQLIIHLPKQEKVKPKAIAID